MYTPLFMGKRSLPRYFVPRSGDSDEGAYAPGAFPYLHPVDLLYTSARHTYEREWIVMVDGTGSLQAIAGECMNDLPAEIQSELSFNEVLSSGNCRLVNASEFYLFSVQLLEQPTEAPGLNDPVYLYGRMFGPCSTNEGQEPGIDGQLTVSRADLLLGLVQGADYAFQYAGQGGEHGKTSRCFHMVLPGDRDEEVRQGKGIVIAYPLLPPELLLTDVSNELIVSHMLYDVLAELKDDVVKERINHPLKSQILPVPSRSSMELQLEGQGYVVKGNTAVRKIATSDGFTGFLASVYGTLMKDKLELPQEGTIGDFIDIARQAIKSLPGWPPPRSAMMRDCVRRVPEDVRARAASSRSSKAAYTKPVKIPQSSYVPPAPSGATASNRSNRSPNPNQTPDWMQDFMNAHKKAGSSTSRVTASVWTARDSQQANQERSSRPDWMKDFDQGGGAPIAAQKRAEMEAKNESKKEAQAKEWMKDFE